MIREAIKSDIDWMVKLSHHKRLAYSKEQPNFWKMAKNSDEVQQKYFEKELKNDDVIALIYEGKQGFIIGKLVMPPEVYDAGLTLMIDDFCIKSGDLWVTIGKELLDECVRKAKNMGAKQVLAVCGDFDKEKYLFLKNQNLSIASNWFTKII